VSGPTYPDPHVAFEAMLAIARREVLILAVAVQSQDAEGRVIGAARLRWALSRAEELAGSVRDGALQVWPRLAAVRRSAERWAAGAERVHLTATTLDRLLAGFGAASDADPRVIDATATTLDDLDLDDLHLPGLSLRRAEVTRVSARHAQLEHLDAIGSTVVQCRFDAASMALASLDEITMEDCDLSRANLERVGLRGARVARCRFGGSVSGAT